MIHCVVFYPELFHVDNKAFADLLN